LRERHLANSMVIESGCHGYETVSSSLRAFFGP
jgi:hypothetical protein